MPYRVLLVDDHQIMLDGLSLLLEGHSDFEVVGVALDGRSAVEKIDRKRPDAVVMDASMPGMTGIEATRRIREISPKIRIVCLSMHKDPEIVRAMLRAGASAYLLKEDAAKELIKALQKVLAGHSYLSPRVADSVIQVVRDNQEGSSIDLLTAREREVLQLLAEGHSSRTIGELLGISTRTVTTHRENLSQKLGVRSIASLTRYAIRKGIASREE